jgi:DNA/RNA-binding domain of Phe-tRNA-synthetase-like protein
MIGSVPEVPAFTECFPWPDAVVPLADDGSDVAEVIDALEQDPERRSAISRRNMAESLRRHDAIHRWRTVLTAVGLPPEPAVERRVRRCRELADQLSFDPSVDSTAGDSMRPPVFGSAALTSSSDHKTLA